MNQDQLDTLRNQVEQEDVAVDRAAVLQLISDHSSQQRAESFWSARAPALNDEVLILRRVEASARALRVALAPVVESAGRMSEALSELDALRTKQAAA